MMKPSFLRGVKMSREEKKEYENTLSNWIKAHDFLTQAKTVEEAHDHLSKMLLVELQTRRRPNLVAKLKARFNRVRNTLENEEIIAA